MCASYRNKGRAICRNNAVTPVGTLDREVIAQLVQVLSDDAIDRIVAEICDAMAPKRAAAAVPSTLPQQIAALTLEIDRLTDAIAQGAAPAPILEAIRARELQRRALQEAAARVPGPRSTGAVRTRVAARAREILLEWRRQLLEEPAALRPLLGQILHGPIVVTPEEVSSTRRGVRFTGQAHILPQLSGSLSILLASQEPASWNHLISFVREMRTLQASGISSAF